ncbi:MAG TPA: PLP-dependent aminotransferase family protein [Chthoniobacteraceae bacterium]|nr:PLP-dependent aminotransferase family protein [Chthoniobacteraceae bacterium]
MITSADSSALYEQVADRIEKLIRTGTLRAGERIPSVRRASAQHGVSMTTAIQAYLALENRGLIEARPRSGYYVRALIRDRVPEPLETRPRHAARLVGVGRLLSRLFDADRNPEVVPLGAAYPGAENLPSVKLSRIMASVARSAGSRGVCYDMPPGSEHLRRQLARRSLDWGTQLSPDEIITTCGATEALTLCLRAVTKPGDIVAVESPTYFGVLHQIEELRLKAVEIPMHPRDGMQLDALESALKKHRVAACLAVPNFSNPLGSLMPDENKQRMLELLAKRDIPLIEDDINGPLCHAGFRPRVVHSWDQEGRVMLCGGFSKTIAPGYRVGWVAPGRYYEKVKALKLTNTLATPTLPQLAVAEFVANGGYDHHLRSLRRNLGEQVARMSEAIADAFPKGIKITRPQGGFVLWVELPKKVSALELHELALAEKVSIAPGPMFSASLQFENFIRINCGHPWSSRIERAIGTLGRLVQRLG